MNGIREYVEEYGKPALRAVFALLVVASLATVAYGALVSDQGETVFREGENVVDVSEADVSNVTVFTTSQHGNNHLTAVAPNGSVIYHDDDHDIYNDVDPSPEGSSTVLYAATDTVPRGRCDSPGRCHVNVVERANLSTGETEVLFSYVTDMDQNQIHDVDRVSEHQYVVAGISHDRIFVHNTTSGLVDWAWHVQSDFDVEGGGVFPGDWTHLNDVEVLADGRYMVNLRNQDQVVFVDRDTGYRANWTLGEDDDHSTLYEAHNPDFIPREDGGPAVVVGDSENGRVVEYQRVDGEWERTWMWTDARMQWPRDADRLPNGHTLIADSNGRRILQVNTQGEVVWKITANGVYDVERLGTGDESTGGPSAASADLVARGEGFEKAARDPATGTLERIVLWYKETVPSIALNGALYVLPPWITVVELMALTLLVVTGLVWGVAEWYWSPYALSITQADADGRNDASDANDTDDLDDRDDRDGTSTTGSPQEEDD